MTEDKMDIEAMRTKLRLFSKEELITELLAALIELAKRSETVPMLPKADARTILCGLFPAGIDVDHLSLEAKREIRTAIEVVLVRTKSP